jgi:hypothetical protein
MRSRDLDLVSLLVLLGLDVTTESEALELPSWKSESTQDQDVPVSCWAP